MPIATGNAARPIDAKSEIVSSLEPLAKGYGRTFVMTARTATIAPLMTHFCCTRRSLVSLR